MKFLTPQYQFSPKIQEQLYIKTRFFDLTKNSIMYKEFRKYHDDSKSFVMKILPELFDSINLNIFLEYDRQVAKFINNKNIQCIDKLIYNKTIDKNQPEFQNDPFMQLDFG